MTKRSIRLKWHGHSCFSLSNSKYTLVLDPYKSDMIGYPPLKLNAHVMLASHQHQDHNYQPAVHFLPAPENILHQINHSKDWPENADPNIFWYKTIHTKHDASGGKERGENTVHIIHTAGLTIAHLGDLGHLLSDNQAKDFGKLDLLLIPVGGHFTIDAGHALKTIKQLDPRNVAPMHYKTDNLTLPIAPVDDFLEQIGSHYQVRKLNSPKLSLTDQDENTCFLFQFE